MCSNKMTNVKNIRIISGTNGTTTENIIERLHLWNDLIYRYDVKTFNVQVVHLLINSGEC